MLTKGALGGLLAGISLAFWAGTGSFFYPAPPTKSIPLQLSTLNCTLANTTEALIMAAPTVAPERYFPYCYHLSLRFAKCAIPACSWGAGSNQRVGWECRLVPDDTSTAA